MPHARQAGHAPEWEGTDRFRVVRRIGAGGMGVVYEALDRDRRQNVALKMMSRFEPAALYLFKREFRILANVTHPNLVNLYELISKGDVTFLTMELVSGVDFKTYVRSDPLPAAAAPEPSTASTAGKRAKRAMTWNEARLRDSLRQLVEGVFALHRSGRLHRDIKPSNVLVTDEGRVVLLDFGVATETHAAIEREAIDAGMVGTMSYMAPEQALGTTSSDGASDWYCIGVMLYEALVGEPPFVGTMNEVLARKLTREPIPPSERAAGIPDDLNALCVSLLATEPANRPRGAELLRRVGGKLTSSMRFGPAGATSLIGREKHVQALHEAFEATLHGQAVAVRVHGGSGMGKTVLVKQFLDEVQNRRGAVVLRGRAYEHESVPYKALDSLIDDMSRYLAALEPDRIGPLIPREVWALARLFPVLRTVPAIASVPPPLVPVVDPHDIRRRAHLALRNLLRGMAERQPLVLYIDDLQWGDLDSAGLILEFLRPPEPPSVLLVLSYRSEDAQSSVLLRALDARAKWTIASELRDVEVGPLEPGDAESLVCSLLGDYGDAAQAQARVIAREAAGSAFLIEEIARFLRSTRGSASERPVDASDGATVVRLDRVLAHRLERVPSEARTLFELAAVAGRPLDVAILASAAGLSGGHDAIARLATGRFLRTTTRDEREVAETYHDRIRETVVAQLAPDVLRERHRALGVALEAASSVDHEGMALHFIAAGAHERAAGHALRGAERAAAALAFDRAATLYAIAARAKAGTPEERPLRISLAKALADAGRGADAAREYLGASTGAGPLEEIDLRREAAEQLIAAGHLDQGVQVMRPVLDHGGVRLPSSVFLTVVFVAFSRLVLALRGFGFPRSPRELSSAERARVVACFAATRTLGTVDPLLSRYLQARHALLALRTGEPRFVLDALLGEVSFQSSMRGTESPRELALNRTIDAIASRLDDDARALLLTWRAIGVFLRGRWKQAKDTCERAEALMLQTRGARPGELSTVRVFHARSLYYLGELAELTRIVPLLIADADKRGDRYTCAMLSGGYPAVAWLVVGDVADARRRISEAMELWPSHIFGVQAYTAIVTHARIDLYRGDPAQAYHRMTRDWRKMERSLILRVQYVRVEARYHRACTALACAIESPARALIDEAESLAERIDREKLAWAKPLAQLLFAGVALARKDRAGGESLLRAAIDSALAADMLFHAQVARYRLGHLLEGDEGKALVRDVEAWMTAQGVRDPVRIAAVVAPIAGPLPASRLSDGLSTPRAP